MSRRAIVTVILISCLVITGVSTLASAAVQFRAMWADAFKDKGFMYNKQQIDDMVASAVKGNFNAIIAEVMAYQDSTSSVSHGAFWNSKIVPKSLGIDPTDLPNGDPLLYLVQQAHANGIEVHCWMVAYRVGTVAWPPTGNDTLIAHPEWFMTTKAGMGLGVPPNPPAKIGSDYALDPGSPDVQEYLIGIVRELVTNYEIDGIHWDYIRYTQTNAGYPADLNYQNSGLKRFQRIYGRSDVPNATGDAQWNAFRRREISEWVRRVRFEVQAITSNPRQPLRHTASVITWGNAPADFHSSSAYASCFQDWEWWMQQGYLDGACPMCYYFECNSSHATWYRNWVNACVGWRHDRHMFIGQATYENLFPETCTQLQYAYDAGADGTVDFSYYATTRQPGDPPNPDCTKHTWANDPTWYDYVSANLFTSPATLPTMSWHNLATATEGTLYGRVTTSGTGLPVDDATVTVAGSDPVQTDGNGYYIATMLPAVGSGTTYSATARKSDYPAPGVYPSQTKAAVITPAGLTRLDFVLGFPPTCSIASSPASASCGLAMAFDSGAADPDGTIASVEWSFGDGTTATGNAITHQYASPGTYLVTARACDNDGYCTDFSAEVTVADSIAPVISVEAPASSCLLKQPLTISFAASDNCQVASLTAALNGDPISNKCRLQAGTTPCKVGANTLVVVATDSAGNTASVKQTFVVTYDFDGFLPPINKPREEFRLRSTIPVKFRLSDYNGEPVHGVSARLFIAKQERSGSPAEMEAVSTNGKDEGNAFRELGNQYVFNLCTRCNISEGTWRLRADVGDGCHHSVIISIR